MDDSENSDNDLLGNCMASQTFHHSSGNIMDEYVKCINKEWDEGVKSPLEW